MVNSNKLRVFDALNHHLCNSIAALEVNGMVLVGIQERDGNFATVPGIHGPGSIDNRQPVFGCESGTGVDQSHESVRQCNGDTCWNEFAFTGGKVNILTRAEIGTSISRVGIRRGLQAGVEHFQLHLQSGGAICCGGFAAVRDCGSGIFTEYCGLVTHSGPFYRDLILLSRSSHPGPTAQEGAAGGQRPISWIHAYA